MKRKMRIATSLVALGLLVCTTLLGASDDKVKVKGMIISRTGETLTVKTSSGEVNVVLTDETKTKDNKGLIGLRKEYMANTVLIPGLKVDVDGANDAQGRIVAKTITVDGDDLETAEMIQAGLNPTAQQVQENTERFSKLGEYDVKAEATVRFAVGSTQVSARRNGSRLFGAAMQRAGAPHRGAGCAGRIPTSGIERDQGRANPKPAG